MVVVVIKKKRFELNQSQKNHMKVFAQSEAISQNVDKQMVVDIFSPEIFSEMLRLLALAEQINYNFPDYPSISTNNLLDVLPAEIAKQLLKKEISQLNELYKVAHYFICNGIRKIVVAAFACRVYFHPTLSGYYDKRNELGIKKDMSEELKMSMKEKYPFYN